MTNKLFTFVVLLALYAQGCADNPTPPMDMDGGEITADIEDTNDEDTNDEDTNDEDINDADTGTPDVMPDLVDATSEELCTNGVLDEGEDDIDCGGECPPCATEGCGNGVLDFGEACDDGNVAYGDGCSSMCTVEFQVLSANVPGAEDGVLQLLVGTEHRVELEFEVDMPDCDECIAGALLLRDGEVVACATAERVPRASTETLTYAPPRELGAYGIDVAIAWAEGVDGDGCEALSDAVQEDPSKIALAEPLVDVEVVAFPDEFTIEALSEYCVDVPGASQDDGVGLIGWPCTANDNQRVRENEGAFSMVHSGKCLAVDNRDDEPYPEEVVQLPCGEAGLQVFALRREARGYSLTTQADTCVEFVYRSSLGNYQLYHRECGEPATRFQTFAVVAQD